MPNITKGDVLLTERFGLSSRQILFLRKSGSEKLSVLDTKKSNHYVANIFYKIFLPRGYPVSVSEDYMAYQLWDTLQAFCSTITGILATQEVLRGVGVGDDTATPLAATITWVIKDGCGHIGRILFTSTHSSHLDAYSKTWRWYADILNDMAMCLELNFSSVPGLTTPVLCCSTVMKAIVGVAGGSTRMAMTQHHATRGNLADVAAKDAAQETTVNLVASLTALLIITIFKCTWMLNVIFGLLIVLHVLFNYNAVRATCLNSLNEPRLIQCIKLYMTTKIFGNPTTINHLEFIIFYNQHFMARKLCGYTIKTGCSIKKYMTESTIDNLIYLKSIYNEKNYILVPDTNDHTIYVLLKDVATSNDIFEGYFHSILLSLILTATKHNDLPLFSQIKRIEPFDKLHGIAESAKQSLSSGNKINLSEEIYQQLDELATTEWNNLRNGLCKTGWDLSTHLLLVDEWRITQDIPMSVSLKKKSIKHIQKKKQ